MAYDKVIDSSKLDSAMTATADAIRAKTGGSDILPWDMDTGFASAVEAIEAGGDNSMLISLLQGEYKKKTSFVLDIALETLVANFRDLISGVELMDINVAELQSKSISGRTSVLILRYNGVVTLADSSTIEGTRLWDIDGDPNYGGDIYVPEQYINSYKTATNWSSAFNGSIKLHSIEGSEYE